MKKLLTVISILSLVFCSISGLSEGIDLKSMSDEELIELELAVREEISNRRDGTDFVLYPGNYIIGEDIASGRYILRPTKFLGYYDFGIVRVYEDRDSLNNEKTFEREMLYKNDEYSFSLKDGYILNVDSVVIAYIQV